MVVKYLKEIHKIESNQIPVDLHCHSTNSDGAFDVYRLLDLVKINGGRHIALTDHDTLDGIKDAKEHAAKLNLNLISGVEISVTWNNNLIHILGLNVDENNIDLVTNLNVLQSKRLARGQEIAAKLARIGIPNSLNGALKYCSNPNALSRTHFSKFLVNNGFTKPGKAFVQFLAPGRPAYVNQEWASLKDAVKWIIDSQGIAAIAHPARYRLTRTKLLKLITEFKYYGGEAIEVVSSSHSPAETTDIALIAKQTNLLASVGSDFHDLNDNFTQRKVGINCNLPAVCNSIYSRLGICDI